MSGFFATLRLAQSAAGGNHTVQRVKRGTTGADFKGSSS